MSQSLRTWSLLMMSLIVGTKLRGALSNEVESTPDDHGKFQSFNRRLFHVLERSVNDLMALESRYDSVHPSQVLKPPSDFQFVSSLSDSLSDSVPMEGLESQQVSIAVEKDPQTAPTEHKHHKDYSSGFTKSSGHKGGEGFKNSKGYEGSNKGKSAKKEDSGFYDKGGKKYGGHEHKSKFHAKKESGKKGSKGKKFGEKGFHNKGTKTKGFKNVFHKEESGVTNSFYNDKDNKKYSKKYDHLDSYYQSKKGGNEKGSEIKGSKHHGDESKKGFFKKGNKHEDKGGHKSEYGKGAHGEHKTSFAKKKGDDKGYGGGNSDHDGHHAAHSNTITVQAPEGVNQPIPMKAHSSDNKMSAIVPFSSQLNSENGQVDMAIAEQNEIQDVTKIKAPDSRKARKKAREQNDPTEAPVSTVDPTGNKYPTKQEIVVKKNTPNTRGFSYIKKSSTPKFNNCSTDASKECTTYTQNSRSTIVVEYTDSDYEDDDEPEEKEYPDDSDSEDDINDSPTEKAISESEASDSVKSDVIDAGTVPKFQRLKATAPEIQPNQPISTEALLLLIAQLQQAQSLVVTTTTTPKTTTTLSPTSTTIAPQLPTEVKRRQLTRERPMVSSTTVNPTTLAPPHSPELESLLERRRKLKQGNWEAQKERLLQLQEPATVDKTIMVKTVDKDKNANDKNNDVAKENGTATKIDRSAYRERLAARRGRLAYITRATDLVKLATEDEESDLVATNKIRIPQTTIKTLVSTSESPVAELDKSPFLVPGDWDSIRISETTTATIVTEAATTTNTPQFRRRSRNY